MKIKRGDYQIETTERIFNMIYKPIGYEEVLEEKEDNEELPFTPDEKDELSDLTVKELKEMAKEREIENYSTMLKDELVEALAGE